jgi:hypothetical protein
LYDEIKEDEMGMLYGMHGRELLIGFWWETLKKSL